MSLQKTFIPYRGYWSTPFCRWQGSLASAHSLELAAETARGFLSERGVAPETFDSLFLGITVHQVHSFYGAPWLAGLLGAPGITGPTLSQACATSARVLASAAMELEIGQRECVLAVTCDRTSNGPHVYYPDPGGPGGMGTAHNPVWDNFSRDPFAGFAMIETAEHVAAEAKISREEQDEVTLLRHQQYEAALADDRAFQRGWMRPVELRSGRKVIGVIDADEGIHPTTADGLAKLRPVQPGGTVTFGTQTHPADGNAGLIIATEARARQLSADPGVTIRVLGYGEARVKRGFMPTAAVPAARHALQRAGVALADVKAIKTHNPFAVNDVYFSREMGVPAEAVNRYGSPLIWGHPQAPTGTRAIIEIIEELVAGGGGVGLFSGCAAGDTAMAVVLQVG